MTGVVTQSNSLMRQIHVRITSWMTLVVLVQLASLAPEETAVAIVTQLWNCFITHQCTNVASACTGACLINVYVLADSTVPLHMFAQSWQILTLYSQKTKKWILTRTSSSTVSKLSGALSRDHMTGTLVFTHTPKRTCGVRLWQAMYLECVLIGPNQRRLMVGQLARVMMAAAKMELSVAWRMD
jgi:hypothetical protein